ncbi:hypothetical protein ACHAPZ_011538 [Fusarium culmorum]
MAGKVNGSNREWIMGGNKLTRLSALVVFKGILYAFVPWKATSGSDSGCQIWSYDEKWFNQVGEWGSTWCTPITAVEHKGVLHVVGYNTSDDNHFVWTYSEATTTTITGPSGFSPNSRINESSSSNPALVIVNDTLHLFFLASGSGRSVLDTCMNGQEPLSWIRITGDDLDESGNSGISAVSNPTSDLLWICFKTHNGEDNLTCHWSKKKPSWTKSVPLGSGGVFPTKNEAALVYSNGWVYAVWNRAQNRHLLRWSRRPVHHLDPSIWMSYLASPSTSIAQMSIPGTHNSATSSWNGLFGPQNGWICCQDMSITQQLNAGIRYFDIRAGYANLQDHNNGYSEPLCVFHGKFYAGISIEDVLEYFYNWLDTHPTEGIIVQIKADGPTGTNPQNVSDDFNDLIQEKIQYWNLGETIPTISQLRGKIQLVCRIPRPTNYNIVVDGLLQPSTQPFGINASRNWPSDTAGSVEIDLFNTKSTPVKLWVEDNYSFDDNGSVALEKKKQKITDFIDLAFSSIGNSSAPTWYIGYSSYVTDWTLTSGLVPDSNLNYATEDLDGDSSMNEALEDYVKSKGGFGHPGLVGTLVMDYPNRDSGTLINSIIVNNDLNLKS